LQYNGDNVNFTKICPCFGYAELTQNVERGSSKNSRLQQTIEAKVIRRPWAPKTFHGFAIKTGCVLDPWKAFCCPWVFSGVFESSWTVV